MPSESLLKGRNTIGITWFGFDLKHRDQKARYVNFAHVNCLIQVAVALILELQDCALLFVAVLLSGIA